MSRVKPKRRRGGQPGRKPLKMSEIPVVDAHGDRTKVYLREYREEVPSLATERKIVAYEPITGERVQEIDSATFLLARTGARYVRVSE